MVKSIVVAFVLISSSITFAQDQPQKPAKQRGEQAKQQRQQRGQQRQQRGGRLQAVEVNPQAVGAEGVAWYTTWETGLAEAKRSNRPIFFMSAAAQCTGVSGVF